MSKRDNKAQSKVKINEEPIDASGQSPFSSREMTASARDLSPSEGEGKSKKSDEASEMADILALTLKVEALEKALSNEQKVLREEKDKLIRLHAEMDNKKRRHALDLEKAHKFALEKMAGDLIDIVDNLERALEAFQGENSAASFEGLTQGVQLTLSQFLKVLKKHGIEPVEAEEGQPFNPDFHEAISMQPDQHVPPNTVLKRIQKGYLINERLLRPARVVVATRV